MSRSTRQFAAHLDAEGKAAPRRADVTGHPWPHLQPLGGDAQSRATMLPPSDKTTQPSATSEAALRGAGELLRATKARQAADARLAVTLTRGELRELVLDAALEAAAEVGTTPRPALLDRAGLAQALSTGVSTVDRLRRDGCPAVWVGDSPRFELEDVVAWLRGRGRP